MAVGRHLSYVVGCILLGGAAALAQQDPKAGQDKPLTPEETAREQIERNYRALLSGADVKVTIERRDVKIQEIVDEFRKQVTNVNFDLDPRNIPPEYRIDEFIVRNEPWRSAFNAFIVKAELAIENESPTLIRISRPPRVTFQFRDTDIKVIIDLIARISGANIIMNTGAETGVKGTLTMTVNNVPWPTVLDTVVKSLGYTTVREKYDIIRIVSPEELKKQIEHRYFQLKYIQAPQTYIARMEDGKYFKGGPVNPPTTFDDIKKQFLFLDLLSSFLTRDSQGGPLGRIQFDPKTNTIVVSDTKIVLDEIDRMIKVLDVEPAQVQIDVKYISTINEDLLTFGTNYSLGADEGLSVTTRALPPIRIDGQAATPGTAIFAPFPENGLGKMTRLPFGLGSQPAAFSSPQYFMTRYDMSVAFRAFKRDQYSKLLQEPSISVLDNTEATIFVGEQVPYAASQAVSTTTGTLAFTIGEGPKSPVKIGFQLMVIPKIIRETNKILLTVIPSNEFLSGTASAPGLVPGFERFELPGAGQGGFDAQIDLPRTSNTTLFTRLMVENGRTAVLGGLKTERSSYTDRKIPFLGDLPVIDFLFKQRSDSIRKESLLIFVTPRIIKSGSGQEDELRAQVQQQVEAERKAVEKLKQERASAELKKAEEQRMQGERDYLKSLEKPQ